MVNHFADDKHDPTKENAPIELHRLMCLAFSFPSEFFYAIASALLEAQNLNHLQAMQ
jgi:hypothetical protein